MEQKAQDATIISIEPNAAIDQTILPSHDIEPNKPFQPRLKRQGSKKIFKVALSKMRGRSEKSKLLPVDDRSRSVLRKLVGSIRPLHLQNSHSLLASPQTPYTMNSPSETGEDGFDSIPNSPCSSSSRYASAIGLNELVQDDESQKEEEETAKEGDHSDGDKMIDAKAEEFIADFYLQMKLEKFNVMDPRYREISQRSLGF